jgi:pectate lyase
MRRLMAVTPLLLLSLVQCYENPGGTGGAGASAGGAGGAGAQGSGGSTTSAGGGGAGGAPAEYPEAGVECTAGEPTPGTTAALVYDAIGFAGGVLGGARGCLYRVTSLEDAGPGTLRDALERQEPLWVVFDVSGTIDLAGPIEVQSRKTIDGRGAGVDLIGAGLIVWNGASDVIIENLRLNDQGAGSHQGDGIAIDDGASLVWVDHCSFGPWDDGQLDITGASTDVTVSWSHFANHGLVMLIGGSVGATEDAVIRATVHHNWFDGTDERHPRLRYGRAHVFNNLHVDWLYYGIASSQLGQIASEANIFDAGSNTSAIIDQAGSDPDQGLVRSTGEWLLDGATAVQNQPDQVFDPAAAYAYAADPADPSLRSALEAGAGWHDVPRP